VLAAIEVRDGLIAGVRLALGGVGTKPWRARRAEGVLLGAPATPETFARAAAEEMAAAVAHRDNGFKAEFARRAIVRGLVTAMTGDAR
jgi:xanthine dehydrogenase YagS FAD-binding subunit